jgi:hypothetical protein
MLRWASFLFGMVFLICGCADEAARREALAAKAEAEQRTAVAEKAEKRADEAEKRADEAEKRAKAAEQQAKIAEQKAADAELFVKLVGKWIFEKGEATWKELTFAPDGKANAKDFEGQSYTGRWKVEGGKIVGTVSRDKGPGQLLNRFVAFNANGDLLLNWLDGRAGEEIGPDRYRRESK